jgi:pfkB family carbohydrate kinase
MACHNRRQVARASVSHGKGDDLAGSAAHRRPQPPSLVFFAHKTPNFIEFEHIIWDLQAEGFLGQVGDDEFGHFLADTLRNNAVEVGGLRFSSQARTALAFVSLLAQGERDFMFYRQVEPR